MIKTPVCGRANVLDVVDRGEIYLTFSFAGIESTKAGVVSVTSGGTYSTPILPTFAENRLDVDGYDGQYYFNTRLQSKSFVYNCFIDNLSAFEFEKLKSWIRPDKVGRLIRPEEPFRYYWVKVSSIDNLPNYPLTHPDTKGVSYTGTFQVTFTTIGQACSYGMYYYRDSIKYVEEGMDNRLDGLLDYSLSKGNYAYYDMDLLYMEEMLPLKNIYSGGTWKPKIYNPGSYKSKTSLIITAMGNISTGSIILSNLTTGDVSTIFLSGLKENDVLELDWGKNTFKLNGTVDYTNKIDGDLIYLSPRDWVERINSATVYNDGRNTWITFDSGEYKVSMEDLGKTAMFKIVNSSEISSSSGGGGLIDYLDISNNRVRLEEAAGLWGEYSTNGTGLSTSAVITQLDDLEATITLPNDVFITTEWVIEPRYI